MAICKLNNNLLRTSQCGYSLPEIVDLYLVNYEDLSGTPAISTDEDPRGFEKWRPLSDFNDFLPERYRKNEGINAGHGGGDCC